MSYTELEHGYQGLRSSRRPIFYVGDGNTVQSTLVDPASSIYLGPARGELSDGCASEDGCLEGDFEGEGKQVLVGICAMAKKSQSKPMKEILTRLEEFEYIKIIVFAEEVILKEPVENWPIVDCLISFHSKGFPLEKAISYANLRNPFIINNLPMQYDIQDRRRVYAILENEGIEIPRYAVLDRDSPDPKHHELVESEDHVEVNGVTFNKPFVEKPVSAEDHNIYIYYPTSAGGGSQRLFRKIGSRSSVYSLESRVRKTGSYIYEDFMPTDGTDVKVYTVGPDYAHAEARKSPALDGKVERDSEGKEIRYPVILSNVEKLISRKVCLAFKQTVCGFDLLRANGKSFVCDVNGFSFVKNSNKYYDDCAKILGNMILRELAPTLHIPWSVPFQLDDPPIVPTTFGKMMELRCVVAVIRHGDRTPKQKMKVEVRHPKFFEIFAKYDGYKHGHVKLKRPKQLQEILDTARSLLSEIQHRAASPELEEKQGKLEQLKNVLEMYGHFSGINRKVQMKYQPRGRPRGSSSDDGSDRLGEPSLVLILKWGGELTPAGRIQAEELGRIFRCMYPGGQGRHLSGEYAGAQGLGLLRLHSTFRHDLKIYASDEGRVQMTAAAFAKGLLALEGELTPILVQMVKSANTNGLLDNDCDSSKYQNMVKTRLHELLQQNRDFTREDREEINPGNALSINAALDFVKNPVKCCQYVQTLIQKLMDIVRIKKDDPKTKDAILYHGETWELMGRRWGKIEKDFCTKHKRFDISKIPDIYDCIKYDLQHNNHTLQFDQAEELYIYAKYLADIVIPQEYGLTVQEKLTIGQGICTPLLKKIRADLQRNIEEPGEESVNRLNPRYSHGVSSPGRHVRTRLYFTSESHVHSLLTVLRYGGLLDVVKDEQWRRAMEYVSMVSELNYMSQIVVMLYEDPTKDPCSEERFHVELHFSPGVNCCVQKNLPPGPGFRPHSRNESSHNLVRKLKSGETSSNQDNASQCSTRIEEEDSELGVLEDDSANNEHQTTTTPPLMEVDSVDSNLDSPTTTSRNIDMMDLDAALMDEPYDSGFLQSSAPIPISARTVAGHEAARLGSQLAASQRQRREREAGGICEPRARSYDHQRQEKPEKTADKLQYQSLDAVNKEARTLAETSCSLNVPKCLGKPVCLAHSISSPDLPIPILEVPTNPPSPIISLHSTPLASPKTNISPADDFYESIILHDTFDHTAQYLLPKKYGRSHSEMILPNIEVTGELNEPPTEESNSILQFKPLPVSLIEPESLVVSESLLKPTYVLEPETLVEPESSELQSLLEPKPVLVTNCSLETKRSRRRFLEVDNKKTRTKRSRSLSPCPPNCLCYNCNVSKLIHQSLDLSPSERSNFNSYFVRSLSHKFYNCSCYSKSSEKLHKSLYDSWQATSASPVCCLLCRDGPNQSHQKKFLSPEDRKIICDASHPKSIDNCRKSSFCLLHIYKRFQRQLKNNKTTEKENNICGDVQGLERVTNKQTLNGRPETKSIKSMSCPNVGVQFNSASTSCYLYSSCSLDSLHPLCLICSQCFHKAHSSLDLELDYQPGFTCTAHSNKIFYHNCHYFKNHQSKSPKTPVPKLQHQRSFSSPDTRPAIIQPDPTCTARRHRHSISGQMSYFKLLGYNVSKKLTGSSNSLFSTAVISGSSSAPNLKDMIPAHASAVAAIEGFGGVPPIRSLETLHNALSLRQLDTFLEMMTSVPLFRTPASSPPKIPSPGGTINQSMVPHLYIRDFRGYHPSDLETARYREKTNQYITPSPLQYKPGTDNDSIDIRSQISPTSPNSAGWSSEPPSFLSSEPSSPAPTSAGESSMSISLISIDGTQPQNPGSKFTTPRLDLDFNDFCVTIDKDSRESRGSVSYTDYYSNEDGQIRRSGNGSTFPHIQAQVCTDDLTDNNEVVDDEEEYTLTLRQSDEQKKQDLKSIFQQKDQSCSKSSNFKRIGRFRVESMDITDDDVRIKESSSLSSSYTFGKSKMNFLHRSESEASEKAASSESKKDSSFLKSLRNIGSSSASSKKKHFLRSQSVSNPKIDSHKHDSRLTQQSSFSTMTSDDLQNWKSPKKESISPGSSSKESKEPVLTLASSLKDNSNITVGFNVQEDKKE